METSVSSVNAPSVISSITSKVPAVAKTIFDGDAETLVLGIPPSKLQLHPFMPEPVLTSVKSIGSPAQIGF